MDNLPEKLLSEILETVHTISNKLDEHTEILNEHTKILNEHSDRLTSLETIVTEHSKNFQNIENKIAEIDSRFSEKFQNIENRIAEMDSKFSNKIQNIENIVTKIELEHSEKLQALFDCFTINNEKFIKIDEEILRINTVLDRQDNKIFYLDYHKNQTNLPKEN